ncbi:amino acid kinase family protein, partial [Staphylococcus aureus]
DCETRVLTSSEMKQVDEHYISRSEIRQLEKKSVVIVAEGIGNQYLATDTTEALSAEEVEADVILMGKKNVDGVYSADHKVNKDEVKYEHLTNIQMLQE